MKLILFIILLVIIIRIFINKTKKNSMQNANIKFNNYIKENGIIVTNYIDIPAIDVCSKFIVDESKETVYYLSTNEKMANVNSQKISFKDVLKCELIKDSKTKLTEDKFSIFDNYNKKEYVKKLGIRITFNNLSFPYLDILFLNAIQGQTLSSNDPAVINTNKWISIINIIIERGKILRK